MTGTDTGDIEEADRDRETRAVEDLGREDQEKEVTGDQGGMTETGREGKDRNHRMRTV